jgi:hypothetical protein
MVLSRPSIVPDVAPTEVGLLRAVSAPVLFTANSGVGVGRGVTFPLDDPQPDNIIKVVSRKGVHRRA